MVLASSVPALAQAEDAKPDSDAAAFVVGSIGPLEPIQDGTTIPFDYGIARRGFVFEGPIEASDERLTGVLAIIGGVDEYEVDTTAASAGSRIFQVIRNNYLITTDDGGWTGEGTGLVRGGSSEIETVILAGSGAHEDLTAYLVVDLSGAAAAETFDGVIVPGDLLISSDELVE